MPKNEKSREANKKQGRIKNIVKQRRGEAKKRKSEETEPRSRKAKKQTSEEAEKQKSRKKTKAKAKATRHKNHKNAPNGKEKHTAGAYLQHVQYLVYSDLTP